MRTFFDGGRRAPGDSDYEDACPIATVALEVSSTSEIMRQACADVFDSWVGCGHGAVTPGSGLSPERARELAIAMINALEGAFVLARAQRSTEPLQVAGKLVASAVERALVEA